MMDGEDVYRSRIAACLAAAEAAALPQVKARHLAAARSWQLLLDDLLARAEARPPATDPDPDPDPASDAD
ncbi:hypothetical protein GCM10011390_32380 [Aureimonas endophytica]|uniref:Uncharacterized protein n=1 Tax=Aureimonas endophytica TaxID=2027858 RepID=A0A916ZSK7_9HYPH|nr:hypothetical protein [Aureimonas endophytica]GGE10873.1 hypothetical protein GCM10011390_32380 [Aureimonas endophytica]